MYPGPVRERLPGRPVHAPDRSSIADVVDHRPLTTVDPVVAVVATASHEGMIAAAHRCAPLILWPPPSTLGRDDSAA
jgi:hypothetical protein